MKNVSDVKNERNFDVANKIGNINEAILKEDEVLNEALNKIRIIDSLDMNIEFDEDEEDDEDLE